MAKGKVHLGSKNFFTIVVLSVSVLSLMFVTYASQQRTNTESDAAEICNLKPRFTYDGANGNASNVVYRFTAENINSKSCDSKFRKQAYVIEVLDAPGRNWEFKDSVTTSYPPFTKWTTEPFQETFNNGDYKLKWFWWASAGSNSVQNDYSRTRQYKLRATPPPGASKGKYNFKVQLCQVIPDKWDGMFVNGWTKVFSNCTQHTMTYIKD